MRRTVQALILATLCVGLFGLTGHAEDVNPRIAILDLSRILNEARAVEDLRERLHKSAEDYRREAKAEEDALRAAQEALKGNPSDLSPDAYSKELRTLQRRLARAQGRVQEQKRSLDAAYQQGVAVVQEVLNQVVAEIAEERGLTLILRKQQVVLVASTVEITDEVLRRLDAQLPSVEGVQSEN